MEIREVLNNIGYNNLTDDGEYWRCKPLYRESNNRTSLRIRKTNGDFQDFSANIYGNLPKLISLTLNIPIDKAQSYEGLENVQKIEEKDKVNFVSSIKLEEMTLLPSYNFYLKRGIDKNILEKLGAKLCMSGSMINRIVFPIKDQNGRIIGLDGRLAYDDDAKIKWKKKGYKKDWVYPRESIPKIKEAGFVILVEGISDILALYNVGIENCLSIFGTSISPKVQAILLSLNPKIVISTNNEPDNNNIGNLAAEKISKKLLKFFPESRIKIELPIKKDFGVMSKSEILDWYKNLKQKI